MRAWRKTYPHLDEEKVTRELGDWLGSRGPTPRSAST